MQEQTDRMLIYGDIYTKPEQEDDVKRGRILRLTPALHVKALTFSVPYIWTGLLTRTATFPGQKLIVQPLRVCFAMYTEC